MGSTPVDVPTSTPSCNVAAHAGFELRLDTMEKRLDSQQVTIDSQQGEIGVLHHKVASQQVTIDSQHGEIGVLHHKVASQQGEIGKLHRKGALQQATINELEKLHHRLLMRSCLIAEVLLAAYFAHMSSNELEDLNIRSFSDALWWISEQQARPITGDRPRHKDFAKIRDALPQAQRVANSFASDTVRSNVRKVGKGVAHPSLAELSGSTLMSFAVGDAFPARIPNYGPRGRVIVVSKRDAACVVHLYLHAMALSLKSTGGNAAVP